MRDVLIPHQQPLAQATQIRSTVLQSSLATLRARGHYDDWYGRVDPAVRSEIVESIAPSWMPIQIAIAHYAACEAMTLPMSERMAIGEAVGDRIQGSFMVTLMKSARAAGLNPMILLGQFDRLYARLFQGGSVQLTQTGPKDVDMEIRGLPLCKFVHFRTGFTGVVRAAFIFIGVKSNHVKQQSYNPAQNVFVMHAAWV
ncbi:MAG TPA: hypothetical protein VI299_01320 [Polyangiales bacterium]